MSITSEKYLGKKAPHFDTLFQEEPDLRPHLLKSISKILQEEGAPIPWDLPSENTKQSITDYIHLVCLQAAFASEEKEPALVATLLTAGASQPNPLPELTEPDPDTFCSKTIYSLTFLQPYMEKKTNQSGRPHPNFYRKTSTQKLLGKEEPEAHALAHHHQNWETFLQEHLL